MHNYNAVVCIYVVVCACVHACICSTSMNCRFAPVCCEHCIVMCACVCVCAVCVRMCRRSQACVCTLCMGSCVVASAFTGSLSAAASCAPLLFLPERSTLLQAVLSKLQAASALCKLHQCLSNNYCMRNYNSATCKRQ